jgi:hypothetical protein
MSWHAQLTTLSPGTDVVRVVGDGGAILSRADAVALLEKSQPFRAFFIATLAGARFDAFFWETPQTSRLAQDRPFEFALVDAPALTRITADESAFENRFEASPDDVLVFPNLGGDALLVVPAPRAPAKVYAHLAAFVRGAPPAQVDAFFQRLARAIERRLSAAPLWVSTAGLGVSWLHLRLDSRPKYYRHDAYKSLPS